jgi:hypothetical protein
MGGSGLRSVVVFVGCAVIASCGDSGSGSSLPPVSLPQVSSGGGPVMAHPRLVPVFFADDAAADVATLTSFSQWIVSSQWLAAVGAEYGVGSGAVLGAVYLPQRAPDLIDDKAIADLVYSGLSDGTLPQPAGGLADVLYMLYFPAHTMITAGSSKSCVDFGGYHSAARRGGVELSYAVIAACPGQAFNTSGVELREFVASHELIEAATDPIPVNHPGFQLHDPTSPWRALGGEVGDMCVRGDETAIWRQAGFVVTRSWSNAVAAEAHDPCVPGGGSAYFNVFPVERTVPRIAPGGHEAIALRGWAAGVPSGASWQVLTASSKSGEETLTLSTDTVRDGGTTTLDVAVPASAQRGSFLRFYVYSSMGYPTYQLLPMFVVVGDPCSRFTTCETCARQAGCGFCSTTGTCEAEGPSGSAESSCSGSSFATWLGSCEGFCASHSGSCTDCAAQPGCGWCSTGQPQCVEASHDTYQPLSGSCAYADWSFTPGYCAQ